MLRRTTLVLAALLVIQCGWLSIPILLGPGPDRLPSDANSAALAAKHRSASLQAAAIGWIRGDLWARSAFTYADLLWKEDDDSSDTRQAAQQADASLNRAFENAPVNSGAWLLFAALAARASSSAPKATAALKMAYYTGPSEADLVSLRLTMAAQFADFADPEIQPLVMRDLRLLLARQQTSAIVAAYDAASPAGREFIGKSLGTLDPAAAHLLPDAAKPEVH